MAAEPAPRCHACTSSAERIGGHSNTVVASVGGRNIPVDTGFIVFNRRTYPNLSALFAHLGVPTQTSDMSLRGVARWRRARIFRHRPARPVRRSSATCSVRASGRCCATSCDSTARRPRDADLLTDETVSLGDYLDGGRLWRSVPRRSSAADGERDLVGAAQRNAVVIRRRRSSASIDNHGLLQLARAPGLGDRGRRQQRLCRAADRSRLPTGSGSIRGVVAVQRGADGVVVTDADGESERYDHVVIATHADQALAVLADPAADETRTARRVPLQPQPGRPAFATPA